MILFKQLKQMGNTLNITTTKEEANMRKRIPRIAVDELGSLEQLKRNVLYGDEVELLEKEKQAALYDYCRMHATNDACRKNLEVIRYAVTRAYFGY